MSPIILSSTHSRFLTSLQNLLTVRTLARKLTVSHSLCASNHVREARIMNKLMGRNKTKTKFYDVDGLGGPAPTSKTVCRPVNRRRISVLNKLFMKNITEVLATGNTAHSIEGLGIEISKVAITADFQFLNVLYVCKTNPRPPALDKLLEDAGFSLRHELSKLKLMGQVPRISFVEDKTMKRLAEVEELLAKADKGSEDEGYECDFETDQEAVVDLSQRVYGLNHTKMFDKIVAAKRASSVHKQKADITQVQEAVQYTLPETNVTFQKEHPKHVINQYLRESKVESKQ